MPLGVLALSAALASVVVAAQPSMARRWLGAVLAVLVALLVYPGGECDLAGLAGLVWGVIALPASLVVAVVVELVLWSRRKQRVS